jgi:Xaa-Pro aminopeptidase
MPEDSLKPVGLDRSRLFAMLKQRNLDGIFLSSPENVFYTTGFPTLPSSGNPIVYALRNQLPYFSFISKDETITLLGWAGASMGIDYAVDDVRSYFTYQMSVDELTAFIGEKLQPGCTIGVESTFPFYAVQLIQEHARPAQILVVDDLIHQLRLVKSEAEIKRINKSTQIIDQTVVELSQNLRLGMSRLELIQEAKYRMLKNGAHGVDHVTVAFGPANPEVALGETLEENQIVTLDLGAVYEGYVSDNRRLVYTGTVPDHLKQLHQKLCWVVAEMGNALQPDITFAELHAHAFELYEKVGLDPMFLHVGHSLGLQVDEHWILGDDPTPVEKGMVLNIELYSFSDEGVMIGDEETYVVTGGKPEQLSHLPVDIIEHRFS